MSLKLCPSRLAGHWLSPGAELLATTAFALLLGALPARAAEPATPARVPFVDGLVTVGVVTSPQGDYESLSTISEIGPDGYLTTLSGELPAEDGSGLMKTSIRRRVIAADKRTSHIMRPYMSTNDAQSFPGTVTGFSADMLRQLRSAGQVLVTYREVTPSFLGNDETDYSGVLKRVDDLTTQTAMVNGKLTVLPVIHCHGTLRDEQNEHQEEADFAVLNDPDNPLTLALQLGENHSKNVRIEYPEPAGERSALETALEKREPALVYSLFFSFARSDLRPESEPTLRKIVAILQAHPDWKLSIGGHTDNVGGDTPNLTLSAARAAAVKTALVQRYHIEAARLTTNGFGMRSPLEKNDTPEHRALNRRVELRRE